MSNYLYSIRVNRPRWGGESAWGRTGKGAKKPDTNTPAAVQGTMHATQPTCDLIDFHFFSANKP